MTSKEAFRAIGEVINTTKDESQIKHLTDLAGRIIEKEIPTTETNDEADQAWWNSTHTED